MMFREYRPKGTIRAAEISEEKVMLKSALEAENIPPKPFGKGDYAENRDGELYGWTKISFELNFAAVRAPRQSKQVKSKRRSDRAMPLPDLTTG